MIVVYFSATGTTKKIASILADKLKCDSFEIIPEVNYETKDLDWEDDTSRTSIEMKDEICRPKIKNRLENINEFDTIYLGFPIWWYQAPRIIETFLESYDFDNKKIILFATSGGSQLGNTKDILEKCATNASIIEGKILNINNIDKFIKEEGKIK